MQLSPIVDIIQLESLVLHNIYIRVQLRVKPSIPLACTRGNKEYLPPLLVLRQGLWNSALVDRFDWQSTFCSTRPIPSRVALLLTRPLATSSDVLASYSLHCCRPTRKNLIRDLHIISSHMIAHHPHVKAWDASLTFKQAKNSV